MLSNKDYLVKFFYENNELSKYKSIFSFVCKPQSFDIISTLIILSGL